MKSAVKNDDVSAVFMSRNDVFADAVNYAVNNGCEIIRPDDLKETDSVLREILQYDNDKKFSIERRRDSRKLYTDGNRKRMYVIFGCECQSKTHYAMCVRNMLYDALEYTVQINRAAARYEAQEGKYNNSAEFLSKWKKDDFLIPSVTIVINLGDSEWDGPTSLHEMFKAECEEDKKFIEKYVQNYHLILIDPFRMTDDDFSKMKSELCQVLKCISIQKNKDKMKSLLTTDAKYSNISTVAADMISTFTSAKIKYDNRKERVNMCKAYEDWINEEKEKTQNTIIEVARNEMRKKGIPEETIEEILQATLESKNNFQSGNEGDLGDVQGI